MGICFCCCSSNVSVYKESLKRVFAKTQEYQVGLDGNVDPKDIDIKEIETFVEKETKPIIDYLENNQRSLKEIGSIVLNKAKNSKNSVDHLLCLYIMNNILPAIQHFNYDRRFINKLIKSKRKKKKSFNRPDFLQFLLNKNMKENFANFETKLMALIKHLISLENKCKGIIFPAVIKTVSLYGLNIPSGVETSMPKSGQRQIISRILDRCEAMEEGKGLKNEEAWKQQQLGVIKGIGGLTASRDSRTIDHVKGKLVDLVFRMLIVSEKKRLEASRGPSQKERKVEVWAHSVQDQCYGIVSDILFADFTNYDVRVFKKLKKTKIMYSPKKDFSFELNFFQRTQF